MASPVFCKLTKAASTALDGLFAIALETVQNWCQVPGPRSQVEERGRHTPR